MLKGRVKLISLKEKAPLENFIWNCKDKVIYGPIQSRRLGKSLGINLFPTYTNLCTFDCIYCDCGPTISITNDLKYFAPKDRIEHELKRLFECRLKNKTPIDYITFAGNGEPTLYPYFTQIVDIVLELKSEYFPQIPLAIFTNGTKLTNKEVVKSIYKLDEKIFKLDAGDEQTYRIINRPRIKLSLDQLINRLTDLDDIKISSAVLCSDIKNFDSLKNSSYIEALKKIKPIEVHLYSIDYPTAYQGVRQARISKMLELARYIAKYIRVDVKVLQARKIKN